MEKQNYFKNIVTAVVVASIVSIILGVVLIMLPNESLVVFGTIQACFFIVFGIALIILDIKAWMYYLPFNGFLLGALCVATGVLMFMHPENIYYTLAYAIGIWVILSSVEDIRMANILRNTGIPFWPIVILNILNILCGVFMLSNPANSSVSIVMVCGISMIVNGIIRIVDMIMFKKDLNEVKKYIKEIKTGNVEAVENKTEEN